MEDVVLERRRTPLSVVLGALVVVAGVLLLAYSAWATAFSVVFLAWTLVVGGVVELVGAFVRIRSGSFWSPALGGLLLLVAGVILLRNPLVALVSLTLMAGALFLVGGLVRLAAAVQTRQDRLAHVIGGVVSTALGLVVLFNLFAASTTLLGVLLGVQTLSEGLVLMFMGRVQVVETAPTRARVSA